MRDALNEMIDAVQAVLPVNRLIAIVTVLGAASAVSASVWIKAKTGADVDPTLLLGGVAAFVGSLTTIAYKWLDGWQADEQRQADALLEARESERFEAEAKLRAGEGDEKPETEPVDGAEPAELPGT